MKLLFSSEFPFHRFGYRGIKMFEHWNGSLVRCGHGAGITFLKKGLDSQTLGCGE